MDVKTHELIDWSYSNVMLVYKALYHAIFTHCVNNLSYKEILSYQTLNKTSHEINNDRPLPDRPDSYI